MSSTPEPAIGADSRSEAEIFAAVEAMLGHLAVGSLQAVDCFLPDGNAALYGSESDEVAIGPAAIRAFLASLFAELGAPRFTLTDPRVSVHGDVAWFIANAEIELGGKVFSPYRVSGVLVRRGGQWLWALFNGSEPLPPRT